MEEQFADFSLNCENNFHKIFTIFQAIQRFYRCVRNKEELNLQKYTMKMSKKITCFFFIFPGLAGHKETVRRDHTRDKTCKDRHNLSFLFFFCCLVSSDSFFRVGLRSIMGSIASNNNAVMFAVQFGFMAASVSWTLLSVLGSI